MQQKCLKIGTNFYLFIYISTITPNPGLEEKTFYDQTPYITIEESVLDAPQGTDGLRKATPAMYGKWNNKKRCFRMKTKLKLNHQKA